MDNDQWVASIERRGAGHVRRLREAVATGTLGGEGHRPADYGYVDSAGVVWISETDDRERWLALPDRGHEVAIVRDHLPADCAPYFRIFSRDLVEALRREFTERPE